ncbi:hypothetical protein [Maridesulfovibrio sp.]|uniref:hypothetical protein n=1 Tax=Maridesulfovibrio sp. TaxID=2795000 RepID=UPI003B008546
MRQVILLLSCLILFSCARRVEIPEPQVEIIETVAVYKKCPGPGVYKFRRLDPEQHLGSPHNVKVLTDNVINQERKIQALEATIRCYEAQGE